MLPHLVCDLCGNYLSCDPVYIRENGTNICHRCIHNNGIPEGVLRNLAYEKLASTTIFPCMHKNKGCTMRLPYGRDLWRHESSCSYGKVAKKLPSKTHKPNSKERGVIMTHSGHYYGTITPNAALWTPSKSEKNDANAEVNKEFLMKKNIRNEEERNKVYYSRPPEDFEHVYQKSEKNDVNADINKEFLMKKNMRNEEERGKVYYSRPADEFEHVYQRPESVATTAESSRRTSLSSDVPKKSSDEYAHFSPHVERKLPPNIGEDGFPRFSIQPNHSHYEDIPRASLPVNPQFRRNMLHQNDLEEQLYGSLDYNCQRKPTTGELIQPKRSESFRVGNPKVINELKMRNKLKKSLEGGHESPESEDAYNSLTNSEVFVDDYPTSAR